MEFDLIKNVEPCAKTTHQMRWITIICQRGLVQLLV